MNMFCFRILVKALFFVSASLNVSGQLLKGSQLTGRAPEEQFGRTVRISQDGTILAVAAPLNSELGDRTGRISLYKFEENDWRMMGKEIVVPANADRYGEIMDLSSDGRLLAVGFPFKTILFYSLEDGNWRESATRINLDDNNNMVHAISLRPDGQQIAIAYECIRHRTECIRVFNFEDRQWKQDGPDLQPTPNQKTYTLSLALTSDGKNLVVGNLSKDTGNLRNAGEVMVYTKEDSLWATKPQKFLGQELGSNLGHQVVISKDKTIIAAGSSFDLLEVNSGFINTYRFSGSGWNKAKYVLRPAKPNPFFAHAISVSDDGNILAVSSPYVGFAKPGYVKVYRNEKSSWKEIGMITDVGGVEKTSPPNNTTGWSIALSGDGNSLAVGYPHNDESGSLSGKVIVYDLSKL